MQVATETNHTKVLLVKQVDPFTTVFRAMVQGMIQNWFHRDLPLVELEALEIEVASIAKEVRAAVEAGDVEARKKAVRKLRDVVLEYGQEREVNN